MHSTCRDRVAYTQSARRNLFRFFARLCFTLAVIALATFYAGFAIPETLQIAFAPTFVPSTAITPTLTSPDSLHR